MHPLSDFCCKSRSTTATLAPASHNAMAQWKANVDFPTPPFSLANTITCPDGRGLEHTLLSVTEGCSPSTTASLCGTPCSSDWPFECTSCNIAAPLEWIENDSFSTSCPQVIYTF